MIGPTNATTVTGEIDPGSVTVGSNTKPIKLVSGVATAVTNDLVDTANAQTIAGTKTFSTAGGLIAKTATNWNSIILGSTTGYNSFFARSYDSSDITKYDNGWGVAVPYYSSTDNNMDLKIYAPRATKGNTTENQAILNASFNASRNNTGLVKFSFTKTDGTEVSCPYLNYDGTQWYGRTKARTYSASNTDDIVTIGSLQASTDVVHTAGNETVGGIKTMIKGAHSGLHESGSNNQNGWRKMLISSSFATNNENNIASFILTTTAGSYGLFTLVARAGSLTNVVRRAGNFSVANVKVSIDSDGEVIIWSYNYRTIALLETENHTGSFDVTFKDSGTTSTFNEPVVPDYAQVITATE